MWFLPFLIGIFVLMAMPMRYIDNSSVGLTVSTLLIVAAIALWSYLVDFRRGEEVFTLGIVTLLLAGAATLVLWWAKDGIVPGVEGIANGYFQFCCGLILATGPAILTYRYIKGPYATKLGRRVRMLVTEPVLQRQ
jgi:hypothetical protein